MAVIREELALTKAQVGNIIIASVSITIIARLFIGWLCDRVGPAWPTLPCWDWGRCR
jgi:NNP family nitrate/nitrite transporter-like MFS transporter